MKTRPASPQKYKSSSGRPKSKMKGNKTVNQDEVAVNSPGGDGAQSSIGVISFEDVVSIDNIRRDKGGAAMGDAIKTPKTGSSKGQGSNVNSFCDSTSPVADFALSNKNEADLEKPTPSFRGKDKELQQDIQEVSPLKMQEEVSH